MQVFIMGKWDKSSDGWDYKLWKNPKFIDASHVDMYDQELMELKRLVNERRKFPLHSNIYDLAIEQQAFTAELTGEEAKIPPEQIKNDVNAILKNGGKYKKLIKPTYEVVDEYNFNERKKKSSKSKPKRKVTKKCKCKKVVK